MNMKTFLIFLACCTTLWADCGTERWPVKTLQDPAYTRINQEADTSKTVSDLTRIPAPANLRKVAPDVRFAEEKVTYTLNALLIGFKKEADEDYHVVIADLKNPKQTMIVEIPNAKCANPAYAPDFNAARRFIDGIHNVSSKFYRLKKPIPVTVTGIFFFDFIHGQTGVAPTGCEIHPVFSITTP